MTRKIQTNPNLYPKYTLTGIGDSLTDYTSLYEVVGFRTWIPTLIKRLTALGALIQGRGFGITGTTVPEMLFRSDIITKYDTPTIGVIWGGTNDVLSGNIESSTSGTATAGTATSITLQSTGSVSSSYPGAYVGNVITITGGTGSGQTRTITDYSGNIAGAGSQPTLGNLVATVSAVWTTNPDATSTYSIALPTQAVLTANLQAVIKIYKYNISGKCKTDEQYSGVSVYSQTQLPANGYQNQRFVVMNDTSSNGGAVANDLNYQHATITTNLSGTPAQTVWEFRNEQAGIAGWGRVAVTGTPAFSDGCQKIILVTNNYYNFSSGGDNYNVATGTGTQYSGGTITMRAAVMAAVTAENDLNVVLCDLYKYQSYLIYGNGTSTYVFQGMNILSETTQGSFSWHVFDSNLHINSYGNDTVARCIELVIKNAGWLPSLIV